MRYNKHINIKNLTQKITRKGQCSLKEFFPFIKPEKNLINDWMKINLKLINYRALKQSKQIWKIYN